MPKTDAPADETPEVEPEVDPKPDALDADGNAVPVPEEPPTEVPGEDQTASAQFTDVPSAEAGQTPIELASQVQEAPEGDSDPAVDPLAHETAQDAPVAVVEEVLPEDTSRLGSILTQDAPAAEEPPPTEQSLRVLEAMDTVVRVTL